MAPRRSRTVGPASAVVCCGFPPFLRSVAAAAALGIPALLQGLVSVLWRPAPLPPSMALAAGSAFGSLRCNSLSLPLFVCFDLVL